MPIFAGPAGTNGLGVNIAAAAGAAASIGSYCNSLMLFLNALLDEGQLKYRLY